MIIRTQKTKNYSIIANECFKDRTISARAKGIYAYVMTLPDDWKISKKELYRHFSEGQKAIDTAFNELKSKGYIELIRLQKDNGQFHGTEYIFHEFAKIDKDTQIITPKQSETPVKTTTEAEKGNSVNRCVGNRPLLKTKEKNTKEKKELKTNKKDFDEIVFDEVKSSSVSSSSSFFVEAEEKSLAERKGELSEDLQRLGLGKGQINSLFRKYPMDLIDEAIFATLNASYSQDIETSQAQYFYGTLKNIFTADKSA